jgi:ribA/ribD-fused uncharacterized protein
MSNANASGVVDDPYCLSRFVQAQEQDYAQALSEIKSGRKCTHWIWYIFPQFYGLWPSSNSRRYSIKSVTEAEAYMSHPVLGQRLVECATALLAVQGRSAYQIFDSPDDEKVQACATLFASLLPSDPAFDRVLEKYYQGTRHDKTLQVLENLKQQIIQFYDKGQPYYEFTNRAHYPIEMKGKTWPTSQHYFQAQKHVGTALEEQIRLANTPREASHLGCSPPSRPDWDATKDDVMREAVLAKFTQHTQLRDLLLSTGSASLVQHTANDHYWSDGGDGSGKNMLGQILMSVRAELR